MFSTVWYLDNGRGGSSFTSACFLNSTDKRFPLGWCWKFETLYFAKYNLYVHYLLQQNISIYIPLNCALLLITFACDMCREKGFHVGSGQGFCWWWHQPIWCQSSHQNRRWWRYEWSFFKMMFILHKTQSVVSCKAVRDGDAWDQSGRSRQSLVFQQMHS